MNEQTLRCFVVLAEELHFGRTASRLGLSTSRVSQEIRDLEARFGLSLFRRTSRHVQLTASGRDLLERAQDVIGDLEALAVAARDLRTGVTGTLVIAYAPGSRDLVIAAVSAFRKAHPAVHVGLEQRLGSGVAEHVRAGGASVGVGSLTGVGLACRRVDARPFDTLLVPATHRLAGRSRIAIEDLAAQLADEPVLMPSHEANPSVHRRLAEYFAAQHPGLVVHSVDVVSGLEIADQVSAGRGVALVPRSAGSAGGTVGVRLDGAVPVNDVLALWRAGDRDPLIAEFVDALLGAT